MQVLLLAAGRSRRFWPLADKNFLRFGGETLIERQIKGLRKVGFQKFIIVGGKHNLGELRATLTAPFTARLEIKFVEQKNLDQGMAGAVLAGLAHELTRGLNEPTLIVSTNDIFDPRAAQKLIAEISQRTTKADGALLARRVKSYFPGGYLKVKSGRVTNIVEKPGEGKEPSNLVNLVCHFFRDPAKLVAELKRVKNSKDDGYERALAKLFVKNKFIAVEYAGTWQPLKYPWHVLSATQNWLATFPKSQISKRAQIAKTAVISGPVVIEDGVRIFDFAVVKGPVYLGRNSVVGTHSLVRDSIVGENSIIGSGTEVARSYLGNNVWLHRNYVGDSILGDNVSLGSGAVTGNLRLDEGEIKSMVGNPSISSGLKKVETQTNKFGCVIGRGSRIGINVSIMPGVLIGANTFVGSGLIVSENLPDASFVVEKTKLKVKKNQLIISPRGKLKI